MHAAFGRRFEDHEEHHWPPIPHERRHRHRNAAGWVSIKAWMRLDFNRETRFDLQVKQDLIGVEMFAEGPEWRPHPAVVRSRSKIAVEHEAPVLGAHAQFVVVWIEYLETILRVLREWNAMPRIFVRAIGAGLGFAGPSWNFELGSARAQPFLAQSI